VNGNSYFVEPGALDTAAEDIASKKRTIEGHMVGLDQSTVNLLSLWTGEASEAWGRTQDGWQAHLGETMAAAGALSAALRNSADAYRNADEAVERAWSI